MAANSNHSAVYRMDDSRGIQSGCDSNSINAHTCRFLLTAAPIPQYLRQHFWSSKVYKQSGIQIGYNCMAHLPWHGHANQAKIRTLQHSPAKLAVILQDPTRRPLMQTRRSPAPPLPHLHTNHRCHVAVEHVLYPVLHLGSCTPSVQAPRALPSRLEMTRKRPPTGAK